ncbi:unnamed protein product, partial [marine sediment metagenome]
MSVMFYEQSEAESQTTEPTWQDKLVIIKTIDHEASYLIWYHAELAGELTNKAIGARVTLDGDEIGRVAYIPSADTDWHLLSGYKGKNIAAGEHTLKIQFAVEHSSQTATIRR